MFDVNVGLAGVDTPSTVVTLKTNDGRNEGWSFADGTVVSMTVPLDEPPITVKHAIYILSAIMHQIHRNME